MNSAGQSREKRTQDKDFNFAGKNAHTNDFRSEFIVADAFQGVTEAAVPQFTGCDAVTALSAVARRSAGTST